MTRLFVLADDVRALGREPTVVHLCAEDEFTLFESAEPTFGAAGALAAREDHEAWRRFLHGWFRDTIDVGLVLDADETRVT